MRIIFVRHGQDDETRRGGWSRYGLQPEGHAQARCTSEYLRQRTDLHIAALYALVKNQHWSNQNSTAAADKCSIHILDVDTMTMEVENQTVWHPAECNDTQEEFDHVCR
ncbi:MAG: histidine phosphatase family protein [Firmicutes bacterium]|nr:histidine phosphatase family protein [Bacillota bacterium]